MPSLRKVSQAGQIKPLVRGRGSEVGLRSRWGNRGEGRLPEQSGSSAWKGEPGCYSVPRRRWWRTGAPRRGWPTGLAPPRRSDGPHAPAAPAGTGLGPCRSPEDKDSELLLIWLQSSWLFCHQPGIQANLHTHTFVPSANCESEQHFHTELNWHREWFSILLNETYRAMKEINSLHWYCFYSSTHCP